MRIGLVIPIYLRGNPINKSYEIVLKNYSKMNVLIHICGSEGEISRKFAGPFLSDNVKYFEVPQEQFCFSSSGDDFIRKKFNDSLKTLPINCEWFCLGGADDLVDPLFFDRLLELDWKQKIMAGVGMENPLYLLDEQNDFKAYSIKLKYANRFRLLAGINCFSRAYLNHIGYNPYALKGCETGAETFCENNGGKVVGLEGSIIMFKGNSVLNPLDKCVKVHENVKISQRELDYIETTLI
jgi:hypothetical protein